MLNGIRTADADTVIMAIGQTSDLTWARPDDGLLITPRNTIAVDAKTLATSAAGVYAGGHVSFGPRNAIDAIANGKTAAQSIHAYLSQGKPSSVSVDLSSPRLEIIVADSKSYNRAWGYERQPRVPVPALPIDRRIGLAQIELGYSEEQARREASRCLHCWENTVFNEQGEGTGSECILCGMCVDICPEDCIDLVSLSRLDADAPLAAELSRRFGIAIPGRRGPEVGAVMIKDEDICIRCGLCARRCPVGCITMEGYSVTSSSVG